MARSDGPARLPKSGAEPFPGPRPLRIAVLLDSLRNSYQTTVVAGLADSAERRNVELSVFAGGVLGAPESLGLHRNFLFEACDKRDFDGAILLGGALGNYLGAEALAALCARLAPLPLVSVGASAPGVPTLSVDEETGMRQALEHLIGRHGFRRIAFVRGPQKNPEAERRFAIYQAVLEAYDIPFDPALVCDGTFERSAGEAAVATLIDERRLDFDALVAANDYMALGAIPAFESGPRGTGRRRGGGVRRSRGCAVLDAAAHHGSAADLQQGEAALELLLTKIEGRAIPSMTASATEIVVRQSCGCLSGLSRPGRAGPITMTETRIETLLAEHGEEVGKHAARAVRGLDTALPAGWERQLLEAFEAELRGAGAGLFASTLDRLLVTVAAAGDDVGGWQGMISALRKLLVPSLPNEPLRWVQAEDLWHEARILIGEIAERAQAQHRLYSDRLARVIADSGATLLATQQIEPLAGAVERQLPRLGIPGAALALYDGYDADQGGPLATKTVRLPLVYDVNQPFPVELPSLPAELTFTTFRSAVIERLGRQTVVVLEPLFFHDRPLGCLLLEMGPREGFVYEALAEQVSSAIEGARLVARLVDEATRRQIAERQRLEKEMEIAARIQTSILPGDVSVAGLEVAASMQTATEVGGDYYDVVAVEDGCWIGIGDVAGHGLPTGVVMLMMQSGFGALARKLPDAAPRELLLALNAMLVDNVRNRLGQHEHATLTLIRYRADGSLTFAGAHEEILIWRAANGRCERVPTPGPWVGASATSPLAPSTAPPASSPGTCWSSTRTGSPRRGPPRRPTAASGASASWPWSKRTAASTCRRARRHPRGGGRFRAQPRGRHHLAGGALSRVRRRHSARTAAASSAATCFGRRRIGLFDPEELDVEHQGGATGDLGRPSAVTVSDVRRAGQDSLLAHLHPATPSVHLDDAVEREGGRLAALSRAVELRPVEKLPLVVNLDAIFRFGRLARAGGEGPDHQAGGRLHGAGLARRRVEGPFRLVFFHRDAGGLPRLREGIHLGTVLFQVHERLAFEHRISEARFDDFRLVRAQVEDADVLPQHEPDGVKRFLIFGGRGGPAEAGASEGPAQEQRQRYHHPTNRLFHGPS